MTLQTKRIAVNFGGGYVPGLIAGTVLASRELGGVRQTLSSMTEK